jgi:hypothetical protein
MGAASSISSESNYPYDVYISYNELLKRDYLKLICSEIGLLGYNIITSELSQVVDKKYNVMEVTEHINEIMKRSSYVIVCISSETIKSFLQTIELNVAFEYREKIIYIITDPIFNKFTNTIIKSIIKDNYWFHCHDDETFINCLDKISNILRQ